MFLLISVTAPVEADAKQLHGVQTHLLWSDVTPTEMDKQLDVAKAGGADILRVDVGWASLEEQGQGQITGWYLDKLDTLVTKAESHQIKLLFTVMSTPCWASSAPESVKQGCVGKWWERGVQSYPPTNPGDYASAFAWLVKRYGDRVAAWEIWNEPNLQFFLTSQDQDGDYAAMVKATYPAAKQANPNTTIVVGALSGSDVAFTNALYQHGIKGYFDVFSIHPYSSDHSPLSSVDATFVRGVPAVHNALLAHGDAKPLWLTEFGWSTCAIRNASESWQNCVDESTQAIFLEQAYELMHLWTYVSAGFWYTLKDGGPDLSDRESNYGLLRYDDSLKPAYASFLKESSRGPINPALTLSARPQKLTKKHRIRFFVLCTRACVVQLRAGVSNKHSRSLTQTLGIVRTKTTLFLQRNLVKRIQKTFRKKNIARVRIIATAKFDDDSTQTKTKTIKLRKPKK